MFGAYAQSNPLTQRHSTSASAHLHNKQPSASTCAALGPLLFSPIISSSGAASAAIVVAPLQLANHGTMQSSAEFDQICNRKLGPKWRRHRTNMRRRSRGIIRTGYGHVFKIVLQTGGFCHLDQYQGCSDVEKCDHKRDL